MQGVGAPLGGGDYLMSFLGVVILSFGFRIFGQRRLMVRHAPEIFGSTIFSSAFSLFGTAAFARALGLAPGTFASFATDLAEFSALLYPMTSMQSRMQMTVAESCRAKAKVSPVCLPLVCSSEKRSKGSIPFRSWIVGRTKLPIGRAPMWPDKRSLAFLSHLNGSAVLESSMRLTVKAFAQSLRGLLRRGA